MTIKEVLDDIKSTGWFLRQSWMAKQLILERTDWQTPPLPHRLITKLPGFKNFYKTTILAPGLYRVPVTIKGITEVEDDIDWIDRDVIVFARSKSEAEEKVRNSYKDVIASVG